MKLANLLTCALLALTASTAASARDGWLAWQGSGETLQVHRLEGAAPLPAEVPLGSTWKLFVFAYLNGTHAAASDYHCPATGNRRKNGDEYCCDPGESVDRNTALVRSCGNYFDPARLRILSTDWQRYWQERDSPSWLHQLENLQAGKTVAVPAVIAGLASISPTVRQTARVALAPLSLNSAGGAVLAAWGSGTRFKTFSWDHPQVKGASFGGAAGWLADGTPFWLGGQGVSRDVLERLSTPAARLLPRSEKTAHAEPCVRVDFLSRYPIRQVLDAEQRTPVLATAQAAVLTRRYVVALENGKVMTLNAAPAAGEILLEREPLQVPTIGQPPGAHRLSLTGRFSMNEYLGRVIDREADAKHTQAAQALAVAARTYLIQNASFEAGCFRITDDSRTQRVSLNPASRSARSAALATDELILTAPNVRYHLDKAKAGVLSWQAAVAQGGQGRDFTAILRDHWPDAELVMLDTSSQCRPIIGAQSFIASAALRWQRQLARLPGFEMPPQVHVCQLDFGNPYADLRRSRIYLRQWQTREGRIALAHEFIHLAFARHPNGNNEGFAERWARVLIDSPPLSDLSVNNR